MPLEYAIDRVTPEKNPIVEQDDDEDWIIIRWGCYHAVVRCHDCDFTDENHLTAQQSAQEHGDRTGHKMSLEVGCLTNDGYHWDGNKPNYGDD